MIIKERIEEILGDNFMYEISPAKKIDQATTDILKAVTNQLCDKVDEMKKELYLYSSGEFASDKTETFNQALDEVKEMLKGGMR